MHEWRLRSDPGYLRLHVWRRDRGVCARCGCDTKAIRQELEGLLDRYREARAGPDREEALDRFLARARELGLPGWKLEVPHLWEADHIIPVAEGGDSSLENVRTLCWRCHRAVTADYARLRARRRNPQTLLFQDPVQEQEGSAGAAAARPPA
ncbi:MAG TPA: HNH endonuclease signature motif containing protein [Limnochorda sp.]